MRRTKEAPWMMRLERLFQLRIGTVTGYQPPFPLHTHKNKNKYRNFYRTGGGTCANRKKVKLFKRIKLLDWKKITKKTLCEKKKKKSKQIKWKMLVCKVHFEKKTKKKKFSSLCGSDWLSWRQVNWVRLHVWYIGPLRVSTSFSSCGFSTFVLDRFRVFFLVPTHTKHRR